MNRARRPGAGSDFRKAAKLAARSQTDGEENDSRMMRFVAGEKMSERLIVCAELLLCEELARLLGSVRSGQGRNHVGSFQERFQLGTEAGDRYEGRRAYTAAPAGDATPHSDDIGCSAVGSTSADRGRNEAFAYSRFPGPAPRRRRRNPILRCGATPSGDRGIPCARQRWNCNCAITNKLR